MVILQLRHHAGFLHLFQVLKFTQLVHDLREVPIYSGFLHHMWHSDIPAAKIIACHLLTKIAIFSSLGPFPDFAELSRPHPMISGLPIVSWSKVKQRLGMHTDSLSTFY